MPVVYGRTNRVDRWWRALPPTLDSEWTRLTVLTATANGIGLEDGPRLLLAQDREHRLVGGACLARDLSETMNSDGRRDLYCFVGWASRWRGCWDEVPSFDELAASFARWATPVYDQWMSLDWDLHESQLPDCRHSDEQPAPWHVVARATPRPPIGHPAGSGVAWPQSCANTPWDALRASEAPGLLVTGWQRLSDAPKSPTAWVTAYDIDEIVVRDPPSVRTDVLSERASSADPTPTVDPTHRKLASVRDEQPAKDPADSRPLGGGIPRSPRDADASDSLVRKAWSHAGQIPPVAGETPDLWRDDETPTDELDEGRLAMLRRVARRLRPPRDGSDDGADDEQPRARHTDHP